MSSSDEPIEDATVKEIEGGIEEAMRGLFEFFSYPGMRKVWTRLDCLEYMPIVSDDGSVEFVLDVEHTERNAWLDVLGPQDEAEVELPRAADAEAAAVPGGFRINPRVIPPPHCHGVQIGDPRTHSPVRVCN